MARGGNAIAANAALPADAGAPDGWGIAPSGKGMLLAAVDQRPLVESTALVAVTAQGAIKKYEYSPGLHQPAHT